ncbi:MAG: putative sugar O-methyltransferase [Phycisphaerae bacterium]|nr:putative sugar O-methyltransferase [Phycisphaerae bacterium]
MLIYLLKYRKFHADESMKKGFEDHRSDIDTNGTEYAAIFERLLPAYNKAKQQQKNVDCVYQIGPLWQKMIEDQFTDLIEASSSSDTTKLRALLENFQREKFTFSSGGSAGDFHSLQNNRLYKYQFINGWYKYYDIYNDLCNDHPELTYPLYGNPAGLYYNGQVIPTEAIRYHYYATEIQSLLRDVDNPVICEIGGGLGGQAYKVISSLNKPATYILLDIPEMLIVSSYFLLAALPNKKILLYGENTCNSTEFSQYDVVLLPHFMLNQMQNESVDLFFNSNSLSEMTCDTAQEYIRQIERICRKYFMHINHNVKFAWRENGNEATNMRATDMIPDPKKFKRIYQHLRAFSKIDDKIFYYRKKAKHFTFLYEKMRPSE